MDFLRSIYEKNSSSLIRNSYRNFQSNKLPHTLKNNSKFKTSEEFFNLFEFNKLDNPKEKYTKNEKNYKFREENCQKEQQHLKFPKISYFNILNQVISNEKPFLHLFNQKELVAKLLQRPILIKNNEKDCSNVNLLKRSHHRIRKTQSIPQQKVSTLELEIEVLRNSLYGKNKNSKENKILIPQRNKKHIRMPTEVKKQSFLRNPKPILRKHTQKCFK